jgi:PAS domain S-box-containing protein
MNALLVEHDSATREILRAVLSARGWQVTDSTSVDEAVRLVRASPLSLLIIVEPERFGRDNLERYREIRRAASPYVLLVAAALDAPTLEWMIGLDADDCIVRPLAVEDLERRIAMAEARIRSRAHERRIAELEERLRVGNAFFQELFESAPEGIVVVDGEDRVVRINGEFTRMFGYRQEEILGRPVNDLIVPEHLMAEARHLTDAVRHGERVTVDTVRRHRDGTPIDTTVLVTPIRAEDGSLGGYGIYRDIGGRKEQERALRASEARYRALFDQSPVGVFLCDAELRVTHCNERLARIVGVPCSRIMGTNLRVAVRDRRLFPGLQSALAGNDTSYEGPYVVARTGERLWISVRYAPLRDAEGQVVGGIGVLEDVTERRNADQRLRAQAAELERVNAALHERTLQLEAAMQARSRLYAVLNHELRTPISAVMLYQELLLSGAFGPVPMDQLRAIENSQTAARHLLEVVQDVLDLSRIEAGKVRVVPTEVCLRSLLRDLLVTVHPLAQSYGSEIRVEQEDGAPRVVTDPQRVRQILLNFVSNAAKFGCGRPIVIRSRARGPEVVLEVEDRGIGIDAQELPRLFEDFVQIGGVQSEGGVGLGLAISRRLAELLGGRLEVESEPGVGSTFRLVIPHSLPVDPGHR